LRDLRFDLAVAQRFDLVSYVVAAIGSDAFEHADALLHHTGIFATLG
jgi:hypothetical protein